MVPMERDPTPDEIRSLLAEHYGIREVRAITGLKGGSAHCYRIDTPTGSLVLKLFPPGFPYESAEREPDITHFVRERGIPTTRFLETVDGDWVVDYFAQPVHVQEFIQGTIYEKNAAPGWLVDESARMLGRLHRILLDYPAMEPAFHLTWFEWDVHKIGQFYGDLVERAERLDDLDASVRERIVEDLSFKRERLARPEELAIDPARLTYRNSHGDYHTGQMICDESSVRALIDFSMACSVPTAWEIIRSYSMADAACASGKLDAVGLVRYVSRYLEETSLTSYDLVMTPHLYYAQLLRSPYGYREYLTGWGSLIAPSREPSSLLAFAFWRTALCRWLDEHRHELSSELAKLG